MAGRRRADASTFPVDWLWQAPMWLCLLTGAAGAVVLGGRLGEDVLWPLPALALVLAVGALAQGRE